MVRKGWIGFLVVGLTLQVQASGRNKIPAMIQRIQTFYLFLTGVVLGMMLVVPLGSLAVPAGEGYRFFFYGIENAEKEVIMKFISLAILLVFMPLFSFITIFFFKYRILQMRFCVYNIILMLASVGFIWFESHQGARSLHAETVFAPAIVAPLIGAILTYLAFRGIRRDELLVRSVDRIR